MDCSGVISYPSLLIVNVLFILLLDLPSADALPSNSFTLLLMLLLPKLLLLICVMAAVADDELYFLDDLFLLLRQNAKLFFLFLLSLNNNLFLGSLMIIFYVYTMSLIINIANSWASCWALA